MAINTIIDVPSVQVLDRLYVFETTPYEIEYDESVTRIYVVDECYDAFLEVNPTAPLKTFNPEAIQASIPEWYEYVCVAIDEDSNSALLSLLYDAGLIENEDYATYAEIRAINSSQFADAFSSASSLTNFDEFELFTGVKKLPDYMFEGCPNMESIKFPESVYKLGKNVLSGCNSLENVEVDGNNANFYSPEGSNLIVDKTTRTIVAGCGSSTIPSDVYYIGDYAFAGSNLTEITIPSNIREIGDHAFDGCSALEYVEMESENPPKIGDNVFDNVSEDFEIDVPEDAVNTYTNDDDWSQYAEYINGGQPQPHPKELSDDEFGLESDNITITNEQMPVIIPLVNTHDLPVTYASSDTSIATVNQSGVVTLSYDNGNTNITVAFAGNDEYKAKTLTYAVTVAIPQDLSDSELGLTYNEAQITDEQQTVVLPIINTYNLPLTYQSGDTSIATVDGSGNVTLSYENGNTYITITFAGNAQYNAKVLTFIIAVDIKETLTDQEFGLSSSSTTISTEGATVTLPVINIYNLPVTYTTSNNVVATVDASGNVTLSYVDGVALISIAFAGNSTYKAKTLVYSITVDMPSQIEHIMHTTFSISQDKAGLDIPLVHENRHTSYFNSVIIDNVEMPMTYTYQFTAGVHSVDYKIVSSTPQLGDNMFNSVNQMATCYIPDGITTIPLQAFFNNSGVSYIGIPSSVTTISMQAFRATTNIDSIILPDTLTTLAGETFRGSSISYVNIPSNITAIPTASLMQCSNLTQFEIPAHVTSIQSQAFDRSGLTELTCYATTPPTITNINAFNGVNLTAIYVPFANVPDYQAANNWSTYASIIQPIGGKHTLTDAEFGLSSSSATITNSGSMSDYLVNTHNLPVTYSSSDSTVLTVDSSGNLTVVADGSATITVSFAGNGQYNAKTLTFSATCELVQYYPVEATFDIPSDYFSRYDYTKIFTADPQYNTALEGISIDDAEELDVYDYSNLYFAYLIDPEDPAAEEHHTVKYRFDYGNTGLNVDLPSAIFAATKSSQEPNHSRPLCSYIHKTSTKSSRKIAATKVEIAEGVESIGSAFFFDSGVREIELPSTLQTISGQALDNVYDLIKLIVNATTPPTLANSTTLSSTVADSLTIYVPDASISNYKAAQYWSTWADHIIGISYYPQPWRDNTSSIIIYTSDGENPTQLFNGDKYTTQSQSNLLMSSFLSTTTDNNFDEGLFWEDVREIKVDGNELDDVKGASYMFTTAGNHTVEYQFAYTNTIPSYFFADVDSISTAYMTDLVEKVDVGAFSSSSVANVYLPDTISYINSYAFYDTQISYIEVLASTPPTLGDNVFSTEPDYISVPTAYENDYKQASGWSEYEDVINPQPVYDIDCVFDITTTSSGTWLYSSGAVSSIDELYIDGVKQDTVVYQYQFDTTGTHKVQIILKNNTTVPTEMFASVTNLTNCTLTDTITSIGQYGTFRGASNLTYVNIPSQVTSIGNQTFNSTKISYITLPQGLTSIGMTGFGSCRYLTSIELPSSMTSIGDGAFSGCTSLERVVSYATTPPALAWSNCFNNNKSGRKIYVPAASVNLYKEAQYWSNYAADIEAIPEPAPQVEYSVEYDFYAPGESNYNYINPAAFYIYDEYDNEEFSLELFEELVDSITVNGTELLIEGESDLGFSTAEADEHYHIKIVFNNATIPDYAFDGIYMNDCVVSEGVTTLNSASFQGAGMYPVVNHKTSLHLPSTLATIAPNAFTASNFLDIYLDATTPPGPIDPDDPAFYIDAPNLTTLLHVPAASKTLYDNSEWGVTFNINLTIDLEWSMYTDNSGSDVTFLSAEPFSQGGSYSDENFYDIVSHLIINGFDTPPDYDSENNQLTFIPESAGIQFFRLILQDNVSLPAGPFFDSTEGIIEFHVNSPITTVNMELLGGMYSAGDVYLPSTVTALASGFSDYIDVSALHLASASAPTLNSYDKDQLIYREIYVPETSESQYKSATNWSSLSNNINPKKQVKITLDEYDLSNVNPDDYEYRLRIFNDGKGSYWTSVINGIESQVAWYYPWSRTLNRSLGSQVSTGLIYYNNGEYIEDPVNYKYASLTSDTTIVSELFRGAFKTYEVDNNDPEQPVYTPTTPNLGFAEVEIKEGITTIESGAFQNSYIFTVHLPSTITSIGDYAFNTPNAEGGTLYFYIKAETPPTIGNNVFDLTNTPSLEIYVPTAYVNDYKAATGWSNYSSIIHGTDF